MILHFGVVDVPYADGGATTGEVAQWLENKYGVMQAFVRAHKPDITAAVHESLSDALEMRMMGRNDVDDLAPAMSQIKTQFQAFLTSSEIEGMGIGGVPTQAALDGVSHRFKGKRNKGKGGAGQNVRRPSFIDTGAYRNSFMAWAD